MTRPLESRIDTVAVYRRGAIVTRIAELPADAPAQVSIGSLPLGIADGSVRVSVDAPGDMRATDLRVAIESPEPDESLPPARPEDLQAAERLVAKLQDEREAIARERGRIEGLGVIARPQTQAGAEPAPSPADARLALLRLRETRTKATDEARRDNARKLRDAARALADLRERERRASSMRRAEPGELRKRVDVTLRGERGEGPARLRLEYRTDAARWAPTYALRLDAAATHGTLEVRAVVAQRSGEDWAGVALTLSTATMQAWAELPELHSLRIGREQPRPAKSGWRPAPVGTDALFGDFDRAREEPMAVAEPVSPTRRAPVLSRTAVPRKAMSRPVESRAAVSRTIEAAAHEQIAFMQDEELVETQTVPLAEAEETGDMPVMGGAPAPAASPGMFVASQGVSRGMAKSAGLASALGGVVDNLVEGFGGGRGGSASLALDEPVEDSIDAVMLDYGRLRMLGASDDVRGKLVLRSRRALHIEQVVELAIEVDLGAAFGAVERRASNVHAAPLPAGCVAPAPSGFDYAYRAAGRLDAASDGRFHNLALAHESSFTELRYVVVPRESRDAFRFVEMDNPLDAPLLDGPIDIYVAGDFLLTSRVHEIPEGGILRLGLGVEQRIKVSRNTDFGEDSGGFMGGRRDLAHDIIVELENLLPDTAQIEVRERMPTLSEEEDEIRVEERDVTPPWEVWEPDEQPELDGGRRWNLSLAASEKTELRASYTIRIASKHELVGGNRRES